MACWYTHPIKRERMGSIPNLTTNYNNMRRYSDPFHDVIYAFAVILGVFAIIGNLFLLIVKIFMN